MTYELDPKIVKQLEDIKQRHGITDDDMAWSVMIAERQAEKEKNNGGK